MGLRFYLYYLHVLILTLHFYCNHDSKALSSTVFSVYVIVEVIKPANELADSDFFFFFLIYRNLNHYQVTIAERYLLKWLTLDAGQAHVVSAAEREMGKYEV